MRGTQKKYGSSTSIIIAFTGTDGSGKSTVIENITPWLESLSCEGVYYEHLRPNWLPPLGAVAGKSVKEGGAPVVDPHGQEPSGFLGSLVRLCYYSVDYVAGYWLKTRSLSRAGNICLFDRYFYDILVDPRRMRIKLPEWIIEMVLSLAPHPDVVFCLGADPELIFARKPETSLAEVTRQVGLLKAFCEGNKRAVWIDTGESIEASVEATIEVLKNRLDRGTPK